MNYPTTSSSTLDENSGMVGGLADSRTSTDIEVWLSALYCVNIVCLAHIHIMLTLY